MTDLHEDPAQIELQLAKPEQQPVLANLLQLYVHDFSEFTAVDMEPGGRFSYPNLPLYWTEPDRYPFLIRVNGELAGFVLITGTRESPGSEPVYDIAEFFVLRGFRRRGVGATAARTIWRRFPGHWQVRVMEANRDACAFWQSAICSYLGTPADVQRMKMRGLPWIVFQFLSVAE
jgi:predicted acetyltransferase